MPNKRKRDSSVENIRKKIKQLESQLNRKTKPYKRLIIYSDSENEGSEEDQNYIDGTRSESEDQDQMRGLSTCPSPAPDLAQTFNQSSSPGPGPVPVPDPDPAPAAVDTPTTSQTAGPSIDNQPAADSDLDDEILALLGDAPKCDIKLGKPTHKDLAARWLEILEKGLPKEVKEKLMNAYQIPENCLLLLAPSLNPEVKVALADNMVRRDSALLAKQQQLSVAVAALNQTIELIIAKEQHTKILKPVSDACRFLCDSHFTDTKTRRGFVISSINPEMKDTLSETNRDKLLFGENVAEKLKAAKTIKRSAADLKQQTRNYRPNIFHKNNFLKTNRHSANNRLNWKTMPRKITPRTYAGPRTRQTERPATTYGYGSQQRDTAERTTATRGGRR